MQPVNLRDPSEKLRKRIQIRLKDSLPRHPEADYPFSLFHFLFLIDIIF
jgi:hypothetical protein